jgi:CRISPR-associated protein Csb2
MGMHLIVTVRFLDGYFHGRTDGDRTEWPPSPMRLFQALVAAAARVGRGEPDDRAAASFQWLGALEVAPVIVSPAVRPGASYSVSVPNNAMDIAGRAWVRDPDTTAKEADPRTHRAMKEVRPVLLGDEAVHYVWPITGDASEHIDAISRSARSLSALGWGIDVVVADASLVSASEVERIPGERWLAVGQSSANGLRVPVRNSFSDLKRRYEAFVARIGKDGFVAPPALAAYRRVEYRRSTDPARRPIAAFSLLKPDGSRSCAFDAARKALTVTAMMRRATRDAASGWRFGEERADAFILGHPAGEERFAYLPLPSVEVRGDAGLRRIGAVRRLMLTSFAGTCSGEFEWARRALPGRDLFPEGSETPAAMLSLLPESASMVQQYVRAASEWATVTPVVLPGFDDPAHWRKRLQKGVDAVEQKTLLERLDRRIDGLLRKAIVQAGFSEELAQHAELEWRKTGFWAGVELAEMYGVPAHLKRFPRYHLRIRWRDNAGREVKVPGPVCLGGGRFYGAGLFASA